MKIKKISSLEFTDRGLFLKNEKQDIVSIPFSEMEKTYIQKCKLSFIQKIGLLALLTLLFIGSMKVISFELAIISLILYVPLVVLTQKYKWYRMCIIDKTNVLYYTVFKNENKELFINKVVAIRKGMYDNRHDTRIQYIEVYNPVASEATNEFALHSLSIA